MYHITKLFNFETRFMRIKKKIEKKFVTKLASQKIMRMNQSKCLNKKWGHRYKQDMRGPRPERFQQDQNELFNE